MNEDVPICHCAEYYGSHALDCPIAAEVRALRKDRERLDWLEMEMAIEFEDGKYRALFRQNMPITREAIDAALSARSGEDGA